MILDLSNEFDIEKFKEVCEKYLTNGCWVEIKKKNPQRSLKQNSLLHLWLGYFAAEYGCTLDECKIDFYKRHCNRELFERTKVNKFGKEVKYLRSSADLTTEEMHTSMERFRNWASSEAGIFLPAPDDTQFILYAMQQVERNKHFV